MDLKGIANAFLHNISAIAGLNDPQTKITPVGFLKMLLENPATVNITNLGDLQAGKNVPIKVRALTRGLASDAVDTDDCDTTITAAWVESEITHPRFKKIGIYISDDQMRTFEDDARSFVSTGTPNVQVWKALYEIVVAKVNGLIQAVDTDLVTLQNSKWGVNSVTANSNAQTINLSANLTDDDGYVKLLTDAEQNEVNGKLFIVGNGHIRNFDILNKLKTAADSNGFGAVDYMVYPDNKTVAGWGANHFGVFAEGQVGFVNWNKNVGAFAGEKGGSMFFTLPVPVQLANGELSSMVFDAQLKYEDCPVWAEGVKVADRGYVLLLSKPYGLYNAPATMFAAGDPLAGVTGAFHYIAAKEVPVYQTQAVAEMISVTGITTSDEAETLVVDDTWDFASKLTVAPADATARNLIVYATSDATKATVSQVGLVTAIAAGEAIVTATTIDGGFSATATITVTE